MFRKFLEARRKLRKLIKFEKPQKGTLDSNGVTFNGYFLNPVEDEAIDKVLFFDLRSSKIIITNEYLDDIYLDKTARTIDIAKKIFLDYVNGK